MKNKENKAFRTAFWLLGPLIFYELCTEASAWVCSLFGTQDALLVTGGGALLALPFLYAMSESGMPGWARYHVQTGAGAQTSRSVQDSGCAPARHSAPDLCERDVFLQPWLAWVPAWS